MRYNGRDFSDFGVHVDESKAFGSPEKDYELIEVVGRNGNLSIYNDRFKDIVLSFPCFIRSGFIEKYRNLLAYLNSLNGYQRLETEKEPNHFRKALFTGSVEVQTTPWNQGGFFTINFSALPQRFLKVGENWTTVSSSSSSVSGNPVSIDNPSGLTALTGLSVDIEPVQDLHGYDHPWVGGAGKNLCPVPSISGTSLVSQQLTLSAGTYTLSAAVTSADTDYTSCLILPHYTNGNYGSGVQIARGERKSAKIEATNDIDYIRFYASINYAESEGDAFSFADIQIEKGSTATAYEPYSNICPISGHTSATVTRTGKNLLPNKIYKENAYRMQLGISSTSEWVTLKAGTYKVSVGLASGVTGTSVFWRTKTGSAVESTNITLPEDSNVHIWIFKDGLQISDVLWWQCELGSTATVYEPYTGNTYTVDLNGTRYGGTLDVLTGALTVTWGTITLDGSESWQGKPSSGWYTTLNTLKKYKSYVGAIYADKLVTGRGQGAISGYYDDRDAYPTQNWLYYYMNTFTSANEVKSYFQTNPTQIVYELATPITVQLTAQQVSLLTGTNIISTDMNSLTVTIASPAELENPTLFESKPIIRVYGNGTLNVNDIYIIVANSPYTYIDIDCELMDCYYGSNNANSYVSFSTTDYVTLRSGTNYFSYSGFTKVEVTPRWFEV